MQANMTARQMLKVLRITFAALILAAGNFLAMVVFVIGARPDPTSEWVFLTALAVLIVGGALGIVVARRVWTGQLHQRFAGRQTERDEPLIVRAFWTLSIFGAAMTEAATLFAAVIHMITASRPALVVSGLGILLLLLQWPSPERFDRFFGRITGREPI